VNILKEPNDEDENEQIALLSFKFLNEQKHLLDEMSQPFQSFFHSFSKSVTFILSLFDPSDTDSLFDHTQFQSIIDCVVYAEVTLLFQLFNRSNMSEWKNITRHHLEKWINKYGFPLTMNSVTFSLFFSDSSSVKSQSRTTQTITPPSRYIATQQTNALPSRYIATQQPTTQTKTPPSRYSTPQQPTQISPRGHESQQHHTTQSDFTGNKSNLIRKQIPIRFFTLLLRLCPPIIEMEMKNIITLWVCSMCEPKFYRQYQFTIRLRKRPQIILSNVFLNFPSLLFERKSIKRHEIFFNQRIDYLKSLDFFSSFFSFFFLFI
jgi:hypothetical protein